MATRTKSGGPLQRGLACLSCRKKKLKCDGTRPVCRQCVKMNRHDECQYDNKRQGGRTQKLREKLSMLEERLRELESDQTGSDSSHSGIMSNSHSPSAENSSSGSIQLEHPYPLSRVASPSGFVSADPIPLTCVDGHSWPLGASPMSSPSNSVYAPQYADVPSDSFTMDATPFLGGSFGISPSHLPSASSSGTPSSVHDTISPENKRILFDIFLSHRHQFAFHSHTDRFRGSYHAPPNEQPHPALMNAIYLLACYFSEFHWASELEQRLLDQALRDITNALDQSDRLVDIVQASCLIAVYLYSNHRILEGYRHAFQAAKLAVSLRLHQIAAEFQDNKHFSPGSLEQLKRPIPPPRDLMELGDRISAFWQVFMVDRCWSVANGLPVALPHGNRLQFRIKTPWPQLVTEPLVPGQGIDDDTIRDLYIQNTNPPSMTFLPALRAKAAALYEHTFRLTSVASKDSAYWVQHNSIGIALQQFAVTIPAFVGYEAWRSQPPTVDVSLFAVHTMVHVARLHLQKDAQEAMRTVASVVALIRQLNVGDYQYLDPILSSCWYCVAKVYIRVLAAAGRQAQGGVLAGPVSVIEQELDVLTYALQSLGAFFLLAGDYTKRLKEERAEIVAVDRYRIMSTMGGI